ncbi:MAG: hypothetical protein N4A45_03180 [Flavobacteriales bacterium]|jgi:hypothetical protein|nr:hypothetical protein [Flavobacteriales bacterium]
MSQTTTDFFLTYQEKTNPKHYGMTILLNNADENKHPQVYLENNGEVTVQNLVYTSIVNINEFKDNPTIIKIDLKEIEIDPIQGEIEMILMDGDDEKRRKKVKVKDAQAESRPVKFNS